MIILNCPVCTQELEAGEEARGRRIQCFACEQKFELTEDVLNATVQSSATPEYSAPKKFNEDSKEVSSLKKTKKRSPLGPIIVIFLLIGGPLFYLKSSKNSTEEVVEQQITKDKLASVAGGESVISKKTATVLPPLKKFPVKTSFAKIDSGAYRRLYPLPQQGWMPSAIEPAEGLNPAKNEAEFWGMHHLGPLGVRVRSFVFEHQKRPAFAAIIPNCLKNADGELALNAMEVLAIAPGSPAEGHLQIGDFIIGMEGQQILSGEKYRPEWKFTSKGSRAMQVQLGELIDLAQERGDINLQILRWPKQTTTIFEGP
ncbi:MAG: hypothetical protein HRT88_22400, partial [Lentisphaeraceae bacterium]|nr:hypothetical protein [Lentisphaeraceae bacterium]